MTGAARSGSRTEVSEEAVAAARVVLSLTAAVGVMASVIGVAGGASIPFVAVPSLVLASCLLTISASERWRRRAVTLAGWSGIAVWVVLLPQAHAEAMLAPLAMIVLCLAVALGPERLLAWIGRDLRGRQETEPPTAPEGWIEER